MPVIIIAIAIKIKIIGVNNTASTKYVFSIYRVISFAIIIPINNMMPLDNIKYEINFEPNCFDIFQGYMHSCIYTIQS